MAVNNVLLLVGILLVSVLAVAADDRPGHSAAGAKGPTVSPGTNSRQKVAAAFFGCPALSSEANITVNCSNSRVEKMTKGINCGQKVPMGSVASFACPNGTNIKEAYSIVKCVFPGKWDRPAVTCIGDIGNVTVTGSGNTTVAVATTNSTTVATTVASG